MEDTVSERVDLGEYGAVELSDTDMARLTNGETVTLDLWTADRVDEVTRDLYFGISEEDTVLRNGVIEELNARMGMGGDEP